MIERMSRDREVIIPAGKKGIAEIEHFTVTEDGARYHNLKNPR